MIGNRQKVWMGLFLVAVTACSGTMIGQSVEDDFATNCSSCHTIGGGPLLGPDLKLGLNGLALII